MTHTRARTRLCIILFSLIAFPFFAHAALININTADAATLDSLPHIGAATAQKIIDYRAANGPYTSIDQIRLASTYISAAYYADIAPLITVGVGAASSSSEPAAPTATASGSAATFVPHAVSELHASLTLPDDLVTNVPLSFAARATDGSGALDPSARIVWSFGDGSSAEGSPVEKTYSYAGTYVVTVIATDGAARTVESDTVLVLPASVRIAAVTGNGVVIMNDADAELDLSDWRLWTPAGAFRFPIGMRVAARGSALMPWSVMNLPVSFDLWLAYPDGLEAARFAPPLKPSAAATSSQSMQEVAGEGSVTNVTASVHEATAVEAPAATAKPVAAGAVHETAATTAPDLLANALSADVASAAVVQGNSAKDLLHSPWTLGALGAVVLAGAALMIL